MERKAYVLSDQQLINLSKFLERAELKGSEVGAYVELINAFNSPVMIKDIQQGEEKTENAS